MAASVAYYTSTAPDHEGELFHGLELTAPVLGALGALALGSVLAYLASTSAHAWAAPPDRAGEIVHPAERWLVLANAVAFGSAYVAGAWSAGFILVLVLHHEVQYLYFTYAMARRARRGSAPGARRRAAAARLLRGVARGGPRDLGGVHAVRAGLALALPRGRIAQPLLARRPDLDRQGAPAGRRVAVASARTRDGKKTRRRPRAAGGSVA